MSGAGPIIPSLKDVRDLLDAATALHDPYGATLELCILTGCLPWEATAIRLELIEWRSGIVIVPARGRRGRTRLLPLSTAALQTILRISGNAGGKGQAVTAGRGTPLNPKYVRLDRLQDRLAVNRPDTFDIAWNFHGLRAATALHLLDDGASREDVEVMLGRRASPGPEGGFSDGTPRAVATAERWCALLLGNRSTRPGA